MSNSLQPGFSFHGIFQARILSGLRFPIPGGLPNPGIKPVSPAMAGGFFTAEPPWKPQIEWDERKGDDTCKIDYIEKGKIKSITSWINDLKGFPGGSDGKEFACSAGGLGSIPGLGRLPGGERSNPLQYSCLENPCGQRSLAGYSPWGHRVGHNWATKHSDLNMKRKLEIFKKHKQIKFMTLSFYSKELINNTEWTLST